MCTSELLVFWCEHTGTIFLIHTHLGVLSCSDRTCSFLWLGGCLVCFCLAWFDFACLVFFVCSDCLLVSAFVRLFRWSIVDVASNLGFGFIVS